MDDGCVPPPPPRELVVRHEVVSADCIERSFFNVTCYQNFNDDEPPFINADGTARGEIAAGFARSRKPVFAEVTQKLAAGARRQRESDGSITDQFQFELAKSWWPWQEQRRIIGTGRFSTIHRVRSTVKSRKIYAVKVLQKSASKQPEAAHVNEIYLLNILSHPRIIRYIQGFETASELYIVMQYCDGADLMHRLLESGRLSEVDTAFILRQVLEAITYIHSKQVCHRDIKPENILLWRRDDLSIKLTDFGSAVIFDETEKISGRAGSVFYQAPEQITQDSYGPKIDVWATGIVMHALLCSEPPFVGPTEDAISHRISTEELDLGRLETGAKASPEAVELCSGLLAKSPKTRQSAAAAMEHAWFDRHQERISAGSSADMDEYGDEDSKIPLPIQNQPQSPARGQEDGKSDEADDASFSGRGCCRCLR